MTSVEGKVALISGAARGLGAATARKLSGAGASVVITDVLEDVGRETAADIEAAGGEALFLKHDVTSEQEWQAVVDAAVDRFGGLDVLVNNAGIFFAKPILETSAEDLRRMLAINVEGVFFGAKAAIPALRARAGKWPGGGSIINLSSVAGLVGASAASAYNASKGAVRLFTKGAAIECARLGYGIRVNSVHPGLIQTDMADKLLQEFSDLNQAGGPDVVRRGIVQNVPLGRLGEPEDIANVILYLASDESSFVTGAEFVVDGGVTAT